MPLILPFSGLIRGGGPMEAAFAAEVPYSNGASSTSYQFTIPAAPARGFSICFWSGVSGGNVTSAVMENSITTNGKAAARNAVTELSTVAGVLGQSVSANQSLINVLKTGGAALSGARAHVAIFSGLASPTIEIDGGSDSQFKLGGSALGLTVGPLSVAQGGVLAIAAKNNRGSLINVVIDDQPTFSQRQMLTGWEVGVVSRSTFEGTAYNFSYAVVPETRADIYVHTEHPNGATESCAMQAASFG